MSTEEYQRRRNSFCHFRDHSGDRRTRVELEMSPEDSRWDHLGEGCSLHLHRPLSPSLPWPRRPRVHVSSQRSSAVANQHHLPWQRSPPPRRPSSFNFQGPCFSSPSLAQHPRLFLSFLLSLFSTSPNGCTQGFNQQTCVFHQHSFLEGVSSIFSFHPCHAACEILVP